MPKEGIEKKSSTSSSASMRCCPACNAVLEGEAILAGACLACREVLPGLDGETFVLDVQPTGDLDDKETIIKVQPSGSQLAIDETQIASHAPELAEGSGSIRDQIKERQIRSRKNSSQAFCLDHWGEPLQGKPAYPGVC